MRALLDVNVLIALLDAGHLFHARASAWMSKHHTEGWATCPITQNGVIRILSQPAYPTPKPTAEVALRLAKACLSPQHEFWQDSTSLLDNGLIDWSQVLGHRQVTDAYLLSMAVAHGGRFVSFDARISPQMVRGAKAKNLLRID